jgi:hypothetical protein
VPSIKLRPVKEIPLFGWARADEVKLWIDLADAYRKKGKTPAPPEVDQLLWAPSGMEDLDAAFKWAVDSDRDHAELWKFYYGTWLAGRGDSERAIKIFSGNKEGIAKALLARLLKIKGDNEHAAKILQSIEEPWLQLHPQVVIERDKVLRNIGKQTLAEREKWLSRVEALNDEWVIERRVQLLIDKGELIPAKKLLLSTPFQKVHQTYTRTHLWNQICKKLGDPCLPVPLTLGEDRLATFGAYREFE